MTHMFDMRRLHHGCGESLQCHLMELVMMKRSPRLERIVKQHRETHCDQAQAITRRMERFLG
jgi:hypothetical protein